MNRRFIRIHHRHAAIVCLVSGLLALACRAAEAAPPASGSGTENVAITDPALHMDAFTLDIPAGWKFIGRVVSTAGCHGVTDTIDFTAQAPDGVTSIITLPGVQWTVPPAGKKDLKQMPQRCPPVGITSASQFLVDIALPNMRPGATVEALLPPEAKGKAAIAKQLEMLRKQNAAMPPEMRVTGETFDGARARIAYVRNGQPVEEMLFVIVLCWQPHQIGKRCSTDGTSLVRAPKGQLDAVLAQFNSLPTSSLKANPAWIELKARLMLNSLRRRQADNNDPESRFIPDPRHDPFAFQQPRDGQPAQDKALYIDHSNEYAIDRSVNTPLHSLDHKQYTDPNTGQTFTASTEYNRQWVNSTSDAFAIDPVRESWTELVPK